ncbi:MAG: hypothetical protein HOM43_00575 [Flavobacteriales bacterium]|nr:hypothetical protein [Flavobacteriales bacterium]
MKRLLVLPIILLTACGSSPEEKKKQVDDFFSSVYALPISQPCENLNGYLDLQKLEKENNTQYYSEVSNQKIERYSLLCREKQDADKQAIEEQRISEAKGYLHILGYQPDVQTTKYDCDPFGMDEDEKEYTCQIRRSNTDRVVFFSDPYTQSIGKIFRFILIDKNKISDLVDKVHSQFGDSDAMGSNATNESDLYLDTFYGWGNVKLERLGGVLYSLGPKSRTGVSLRFDFNPCEDMWFVDSDCKKYFGIEENPEKVVAVFRLFGDDNELNESALRQKRDPREPQVYDSAPTEDIDEMTL